MRCRSSRSTLDSFGRRSDDGLEDGAFIQKTRVIVNVHREQARSHRGAVFSLRTFFFSPYLDFNTFGLELPQIV